MDAFEIAITVVVIVVVVVAVLFIFKRIKMNRDPEYAAKVSKRSADRHLKRQQKKVEKAELKVKKAQYKEMTAPARNELTRAKSDYNNKVKRAEDSLRHANSEHDKALRDADKKIADITKKYTKNLGGVGAVKLYADRLEVQDATLKLNSSFSGEVLRGADILDKGCKYADFKFSAVPEGSKPTAVGQVVGGIGRPELPWEITAKPDYCYLFLTGNCTEYGGKPLMVCIPLDDKKLDAGNKVVEQLKAAAPIAADNETRRAQELEQANAEREQIEADTSSIDRAEAALARTKDDNANVLAAQQKLDEIERQASETLGYKP